MSPETAGPPHRCSAPINERGREPRAHQGVSLRVSWLLGLGHPSLAPPPPPGEWGEAGKVPVPTRPSPEVPIVLAIPPPALLRDQSESTSCHDGAALASTAIKSRGLAHLRVRKDKKGKSSRKLPGPTAQTIPGTARVQRPRAPVVSAAFPRPSHPPVFVFHVGTAEILGTDEHFLPR